MAEIEMGNLYDMNKSVIKQHEKVMTAQQLHDKLQEVAMPFVKNKLLFSGYFLLLCHEDRNYTFFNIMSGGLPNLAAGILNELQECLLNRGDVYGVAATEDGEALEIWINQNDEPLCYYFFPCDSCVVKVGGVNGETDYMYS